MTRVISKRRRSLVGWLVAAAMLAGWFFFLRPQFLGGPATYLVVSGDSMNPVLHDGDLVFALERKSYEPRDVIAYLVPQGQVGEGRLIIHRIIGGSAEDGYVVRGDNRAMPDQWRPLPTDIAGRLMLALPGGGRVLVWMRHPFVPALIAASLVFFVIFRNDDGENDAPDRSSSRRHRRERKSARHSASVSNDGAGRGN